MQKKLFTELGLSPELLKAIDKAGYEEASPIQSAAIPILLMGTDLLGQSQTGSGKTAAFSIPAIERVDATLHAPQVLILCPTRELAVQVAEEVAKLAAFKRGVRELPIYGGQSYERQFRGLQQGAQIIIGTPGRVMDHLDRKSLKLDRLRTVILDEADRMLDMGFVEDIRTILSQVPEERQTVFFSATVPKPIADLIRTFTRNPQTVKIESQQLTVPAIEQVYYEVDRRSKLEVLCRLIDLQDIKLGIIFCATKMMVDELTEHLTARGYAVDKLHGDISQAQRERVMTKFRKRGIEFLVATDVAARGLDVDDIEVVFNYDLPHDGEDYVHRIGRTGRAGRSGRAITFVNGREIYKLQNIMRFTKGGIRRERVPSADEVEVKRVNVFFESLQDLLESGDYKRRDDMVDRLLGQGYNPTDIASALIHLLNADKARQGEPIREDAPEPERKYPKYEPLLQTADRAQAADFQSVAGIPVERPAVPRKRAKNIGAQRADTTSHEVGMVRLSFNFGRDHGVHPGDFVGVICGAAKIPKEQIGAILLQDRETFIDLAEAQVKTALKKLNGIQFKGRKLDVGLAG
ncbi:MAG TPA: DEAD/DEAH box helicase [Chthoniobacterales bacterium]